MSAANRRRGADAERAVVNYLRAEGWPDTRRYLAGDGRQPGDIDWHPLMCVEVKDVAGSCWPTWCRQASSEARRGMIPVVVRRTRGVPDVGLWEARVPVGSDLGDFVATAVHLVDGQEWHRTTFAEITAAVHRIDDDGRAAA